MLGSEWAVGQVFFSMLWFALFFIWIYLLIVVFRTSSAAMISAVVQRRCG